MLLFLIVKKLICWVKLTKQWLSISFTQRFSQKFSQLKSQYLTQHLLSKLLLSFSQQLSCYPFTQLLNKTQ